MYESPFCAQWSPIAEKNLPSPNAPMPHCDHGLPAWFGNGKTTACTVSLNAVAVAERPDSAGGSGQSLPLPPVSSPWSTLPELLSLFLFALPDLELDDAGADDCAAGVPLPPEQAAITHTAA